MRFILIVVAMALSTGVGWILGSIRPAPPELVATVQSFLADSQDPSVKTDGVSVGTPETVAEVRETVPETAPAPVLNTTQIVPENKDAALAQYRFWISEARKAHPYPETEARMYEVMMCESGGNPKIVNPAGPYTGLFQYVDGTWNGDWNTYRDQPVTDARAQIFATALAWSRGMQSHWGCYTHPR